MLRFVVIALLGLLLPALARAEGDPPAPGGAGDAAAAPGAPGAAGPPRRGPPTETVLTLELGGDATTYGRIADRDDGAHLGVARARAGAGVDFSPWQYVRLSLEVGAERSAHDWRRPARLGSPEISTGEEPWDDLQGLSASFGAQVFLGPKWSLITRLGLSVGVEPGADLEDGASGSLLLSAGRRFDETLTLGLGLLVIARLEDDPLVVPSLFVRWSPVEGVTLETAGPGLRVTARVVEDVLDATLRAGFELRQWRLEDDRARLAGAVVQETRVVVAAGLAWRPVPAACLRLEVGAFPYHEIQVRDRRGRDVRRLQGDVTGVASLGLELTF